MTPAEACKVYMSQREYLLAYVEDGSFPWALTIHHDGGRYFVHYYDGYYRDESDTTSAPWDFDSLEDAIECCNNEVGGELEWHVYSFPPVKEG